MPLHTVPPRVEVESAIALHKVSVDVIVALSAHHRDELIDLGFSDSEAMHLTAQFHALYVKAMAATLFNGSSSQSNGS